MAQVNITLEMDVLKGLFTSDGKDKAFARLLETILNQVLEAQVTERIGAAPYERSNTREAYRNGSRTRELHSEMG
jgi:transposase-like protein